MGQSAPSPARITPELLPDGRRRLPRYVADTNGDPDRKQPLQWRDVANRVDARRHGHDRAGTASLRIGSVAILDEHGRPVMPPRPVDPRTTARRAARASRPRRTSRAQRLADLRAAVPGATRADLRAAERLRRS